MTLGSLFDGIGGWLLAAHHAGITPIWASEIEPFPCSVTARHFPEVKQLGDITKIDADEIEPVDIVCAGSPCQDLSIAGKRKGLNGERSGLFRTAVDIVRRMRECTGGKYPRYFVWENVPGAFSSNKGADFRAVLEEIGQTEIPIHQHGKWANAGMVECEECQIAWRVLDAQYWGVPQRRRRIFLVADFAAHDRCAGEILFECESVPGNPAEGEGTQKGTADRTQKGFGTANGGGSENIVLEDLELYENHGQDVRYKGPLSISPTLSQTLGMGGNNQPFVVSPKSYVRRLTPTECERLQGLPDGYTDGGSDTARYKALGNGMAQPCMAEQKYPQSAETNEYRYIDFEWLDEIAEGLTAGAEKHPGETWRDIPAEEHAARALRHLSMWLAGDRSDSHIINASMRCMMARVKEREEPEISKELLELMRKKAGIEC